MSDQAPLPGGKGAEALARRNAALAEELGLLIDGATNYAIYMLDPQGLVTIWNRGAERIKGWTEAEVIGRNVAVFYPPDDQATGKPGSDLERASTLGRLEEESWQVHRDGTEFLASVTITALRDDAGSLRGFGRVVRDITDQVAANAAVARREHHLRSILASVPDAMIVCNDNGIIASFSTAAELMFGFDKNEVIGCHISMLFPGVPKTDRALPHGSAGDTWVKPFIPDPCPEEAIRKGGKRFPIELTVADSLIAGDHVFTGFIRDLTRRREAERRMQELQSELVHVSRLSAMGTMAATLAHEINQPLTAIANYLETTRAMIGDSDDDLLTDIAQALDLAAAQSLRAGNIVRRLRRFVDGGDTVFRVERLDALIEEATGLGLVGAHEAGIAVSIVIPGDGTCVMVDRVQIQQVLINLVRNAIQAMEKSARKELSIATAPDREGWIKVTVADTGTGIDPAVRARLFDAFATTKEDGMGLGLSICRTIIEAHGGRIWAEGVRAEGTAFHFSIPMAGDSDD